MAHGVLKAPPPPQTLRERARLTLQHLKYLPRTFALVRESSPAFAAGLIVLLLGQAALPAAMAWVGKLIVDAVVAAAKTGDAAQRWQVLRLVGLEAGLMAASMAMSRGQSLLRDLMRASLGNHVNTLILEKAATLELRHFEDADFYDKMQNARREASLRPLSMALETASLIAANSPFGVWMTKEVMWSNLEVSSLQAAIDLENRNQILASTTGDMREAVEAFLEKRPPNFENR